MKIRKAAGMNQADFARAIGRSTQMVRLYEHGQSPPPDVVEKLKTIAVAAGHPELAIAVGGEWQVQHVIHPGETLISAPPRTSRYNPSNQALHDMLEEVLESGNKTAIDAVVPNLVCFSDYVRHMRITAGRKPAKRGNDKQREIG